MRIWVIGPGALGLTFGLRLLRVGHKVVFIGRRKIRGLRYEAGKEAFQVDHPVWLPHELQEAPDLALFTVKAYSAKEAVLALQALLERVPLVLFQNGIGAQEQVAELVGPHRLVLAVTSEGATRLSPGHVRHTGRGETVLGPMESGGSLEWVRLAGEVLSTGGFQTRVVKDIRPYRYTKLLVNAVINPITALARVPNGALLSAKGWALAYDVGMEVWEVFRAARVPFLPGDPMERVREVLRQTAHNYSSMLQDLLSGSTTEVDYITGHVIKLADRYGLRVPLNRTLYTLIKLAETPQSRL